MSAHTVGIIMMIMFIAGIFGAIWWSTQSLKQTVIIIASSVLGSAWILYGIYLLEKKP